MDVLRPDFHQLNLKVEHFIKGELGVKLDKGACALIESEGLMMLM